jgi:hypothetical protein
MVGSIATGLVGLIPSPLRLRWGSCLTELMISIETSAWILVQVSTMRPCFRRPLYVFDVLIINDYKSLVKHLWSSTFRDLSDPIRFTPSPLPALPDPPHFAPTRPPRADPPWASPSRAKPRFNVASRREADIADRVDGRRNWAEAQRKGRIWA